MLKFGEHDRHKIPNKFCTHHGTRFEVSGFLVMKFYSQLPEFHHLTCRYL
jgi:hypothetical protein